MSLDILVFRFEPKYILKIFLLSRSALLLTLSEKFHTRIIHQFSEIFTYFLYINFNNYLESGIFPDELKLAEVVPVYKKNDKKDKSNYRPISILSNISKIYERCIQKQLNEYLANFLSKFQSVFDKDSVLNIVSW